MIGATAFRGLAETLEVVSATTRKLEKVDRLVRYFDTLSDDDLRAACTFLTGAPFPSGDPRKLNVGWAALDAILRELSGATDEDLHDAYLRHGDLGKVAEELLGRRVPEVAAEPLTIGDAEQGFGAIAATSGKGSRKLKIAVLRGLMERAAPLEVKYLVKIMTSDMRVGLKVGLLEEAIAAAAASPGERAAARRALLPSVRRANMLISHVGEVAVMARRGRLGEAGLRALRPFHFMLAETIFSPEEAFLPFRGEDANGAPVQGGRLLVEDKYDGIRAQVHTADGRIAIYTRTLDDITASFPELLPDLGGLAGRYILDGEILAWRGDRALAFSLLQQRLRRKQPGRLAQEVPVVLFAFDLLHLDGEDLLAAPLRDRRGRLERLAFGDRVRPSYATVAAGPADLARRFREARARGNEGLVIKRLDSPYAPGRRGRQWVKLKEELATLDVVIVMAEHGHGRRAGVLSDVTFAVRDGDRLATIGKAYSGLTDREIEELTAWFRAHTRRDLGRVKVVEPAVVLEVAFDAITPSDRHDSGFALRFPRIKRIRPDKTPADIDSLDDVRRVFQRQIVRADGPGTREVQGAGRQVQNSSGTPP